MVLALLAGPPSVEPGVGPEGEARLSLDAREGDLRGVLRALAEVGDFQVVVDPDVGCRLTLKVERLAWPDLLSQVLRACGLGQEAEGRVVRVAPLGRLASEARERRRLADLRDRSAPRIEMRPLSYARAEELAPLLQTLMGPGAEVVYDRRTNTLIVVER